MRKEAHYKFISRCLSVHGLARDSDWFLILEMRLDKVGERCGDVKLADDKA